MKEYLLYIHWRLRTAGKETLLTHTSFIGQKPRQFALQCSISISRCIKIRSVFFLRLSDESSFYLMTSHQITNPQTHHTHPNNNLERARKGEEQSLAPAEGCPRMRVLQCHQPPGTAQELLTALGARTGPPPLSLSHTRALEQ